MGFNTSSNGTARGGGEARKQLVTAEARRRPPGFLTGIPGTYQSLQDQLQKLTAHPMPIHSFAQRTDSNPIASEDDDTPTLRGFNAPSRHRSKERKENGNDASLCAGQLDIATAGFQDHWLPAIACPMEIISAKDVLAAAEGFLLQARRLATTYFASPWHTHSDPRANARKGGPRDGWVIVRCCS